MERSRLPNSELLYQLEMYDDLLLWVQFSDEEGVEMQAGEVAQNYDYTYGPKGDDENYEWEAECSISGGSDGLLHWKLLGHKEEHTEEKQTASMYKFTFEAKPKDTFVILQPTKKQLPLSLDRATIDEGCHINVKEAGLVDLLEAYYAEAE